MLVLVGSLISAADEPDAGRLTPTAALGAPLALAVPVLPTLFTTSVWRKYMPACNVIDDGVAHTSPLPLLCSAPGRLHCP